MQEFKKRFREFVGMTAIYEQELTQAKNPFKNKEFFLHHKKRKLAQILVPFIKTLVGKTESSVKVKEQFKNFIKTKNNSLIANYSSKFGAPSLLDDASNADEIYKIAITGIKLKKNTVNILINHILCGLCDNNYVPNIDEIVCEDINDPSKLYMCEHAEHNIYLLCDAIKVIDIDLLLHLTDKALSLAVEQTFESLSFSVKKTPEEMMSSNDYNAIMQIVKKFKNSLTELKEYHDDSYKRTTTIVKMIANMYPFISDLNVNNTTAEQLSIFNATLVKGIIHLADYYDTAKEYVREYSNDILKIKNDYKLYEKSQQIKYYQLANNEVTMTIDDVYQDKAIINKLKKNFNQDLKAFRKKEKLKDEFFPDGDELTDCLMQKDFICYLKKYVKVANERACEEIYQKKYKVLYLRDIDKMAKKGAKHINTINEMNTFITEHLEKAAYVTLIMLYRIIEAFYAMRISDEYKPLLASREEARQNFHFLTERLIKHLEASTYFHEFIGEKMNEIDFRNVKQFRIADDYITYCEKIMELCWEKKKS